MISFNFKPDPKLLFYFLSYFKYTKYEIKSFDEFIKSNNSKIFITPVFKFIKTPKNNIYFKDIPLYFNKSFKNSENFIKYVELLNFDENNISKKELDYTIRINKKCLKNCSYCHLLKDNSNKDFDLKELEKIPKKLETLNIIGEIFLEKNCQKILDYISKLEINSVNIYTSFKDLSKNFNLYNFTCIEILENYKNISEFQISYNEFISIFKGFL